MSRALQIVRTWALLAAGLVSLVAALLPPPDAQYLAIAGGLLGFGPMREATKTQRPPNEPAAQLH